MTLIDVDLIVQSLELGELTAEPQQLTSGLFNQVWQINTGELYIIKFIGSNTLRSHADYAFGEQLALTFEKQGMPAVSAKIFNGKQLQEVAGHHFFVYPYVTGKVISSEIVTIEQATCMGRHLGAMHQYAKAMLLEKNKIPSHRDLHPKNVIWSERNQPHIIDWEWAGFIDSDFDAFHTALMWAGLLDAQFRKDIYVAFLLGYHASGQAITQEISVLLKTLSDFWTDWLLLLKKQVDQAEKNPEVQRAIAVLQFIAQTIFHQKLRD